MRTAKPPALKYYRMMRRMYGLSPRSSALSTLMNYCPTSDDFWKRATRIGHVLNRFDKERESK